MIRKREKAPLIDDSAFLIQRAKPHEPKPDLMFRSAAHLAEIRRSHCERCGCAPSVQAAHLRLGTHTPKGETPHDFFAWPGCYRCHIKIQHMVGEKTFWRDYPDPALYIVTKYGLKSPCQRTAAASNEYLSERGRG